MQEIELLSQKALVKHIILVRLKTAVGYFVGQANFVVKKFMNIAQGTAPSKDDYLWILLRIPLSLKSTCQLWRSTKQE